MNSMLCPLYISEISAPEVRGSLMALEQFSIVLGVVLGFWTGFFTRAIPSTWSFRLPLAIQVIPGAFLGVGCLFLPRSPRECLSSKGRVVGARFAAPAAKAALINVRAQPYDHPLIDVSVISPCLLLRTHFTSGRTARDACRGRSREQHGCPARLRRESQRSSKVRHR